MKRKQVWKPDNQPGNPQRRPADSLDYTIMRLVCMRAPEMIDCLRQLVANEQISGEIPCARMSIAGDICTSW